jgi:hypothetical protein
MMREILSGMKRSTKTAAFVSALGCALTLSICATARPAQTPKPSHEKPDWADKIVPGSPLTILDLARKIMPDIKSDSGKADKIIARDLSAVRLVDGVEETGMELDPASTDEREISEPDFLWMKEGAEKLLVLPLKVDSEGAVIGLFKVSPQVSLLDAITIAQDMHVSVDLEKLWDIHAQHQAFSVQCWHDNSSESFDSYTFISIVDHKFRAIAGPVTYSGFSSYSASRQRLCKTAMTPKFQFVRSAGGAYFDLIAIETTIKACHRDSEEWSWKTGVVSQQSVRRVWRWNAKSRQYRKLSSSRR